MQDCNEAVIAYLRRLGAARFWGALTLKLESGRIVHLRKEENLKPEELTGEPKFEDEFRADSTSRCSG